MKIKNQLPTAECRRKMVNMDVKEFIENIKIICNRFVKDECSGCPLESYCYVGFFNLSEEKMEELIKVIIEEIKVN